jgi:hypothetical protein
MYNQDQNNDFTNISTIAIAGIAASGNKFVFIAPNRCVIKSAKIVSDVATSGSGATAKYDFQVANLTQTLNLLSAAKSTNGAEIAADAAYNLGVNQNLTLAENDVLELQVTKTGSPTDLSSAIMLCEVIYRSSNTYPA